MKKSLFAKLIITYFVILAISFSLVAIFLSQWFYNYSVNQKAATLIKQGTVLKDIVSDYFDRKISKKKLKDELLLIDRLVNARIWVVDKYGYIYAYTEPTIDYEKQLTFTEFQDVISGKIVIKKDSFKGIFKKPMLTVGIPVYVDDNVLSAIFLHTSLDEIRFALKKVYIVIWMSAFFATVISLFIIFYISEKILIRPLSKINDTAKAISKGEFDKRVDIDSEDEIGKLANSFNYMADTLKNLENMRRNFIADVSHELRSPMTSINGFISGMLDGTIPMEKWTKYLEIVHDEIKRLIRLINDLLDLASLESGEFSLKIGIFDINELIRQRIIKFEDKINKKKVNVNVYLIEKRMMVKGDRDRIDQVLTNIIDNAIKFVHEGGNIEIRTEIKEDRLLVSIFNDGPPIPKEDIKYIWDRFHKGDKSRTKGGGTGLGLSIARQIINKHNQTIWVESGEKGTKFTFTLEIS
ncbi:sensor histidine kinase [Caloramator australicus]|uniref:histidine kinase n=1 Tax=Caloramator australicus RC3 TaxID=857293 RepID=I7LFR3_9CLOT|nr:HAMP domain-containing sensor histidine kinase [Caloramator australicus]CCJ32710.1 sensory transduction histidine kinase [Caloramator australicus RC3]